MTIQCVSINNDSDTDEQNKQPIVENKQATSPRTLIESSEPRRERADKIFFLKNKFRRRHVVQKDLHQISPRLSFSI